MDKFTKLLKEFLQSKEAKRFAWTILNVLMGFVISFLTFLASNSVEWAICILPVATALSQFITKYLNSK